VEKFSAVFLEVFEMARSISDLPEEPEKPDQVTMEKLADMLYNVFLAMKDIEKKVDENTETVKEIKRINGL
jgi:hypothetical protein